MDFRIYFSLIFLCIFAGSCRFGNEAPPSLAFEPKEIAVFQVACPPWEAHFERSGAWKFSSVLPAPPTLYLDDLANGNLILHFLDAIRSLRFLAVAPKSSLAELGLDPPQCVFRWKTKEGAFALQLSSNRMARVLSPRGVSTVFEVGGSLLSLLRNISAPESFRHTRLLPFEMDEIDEIRIDRIEKGDRARSIPLRSVEREGIDWVDAKGRQIAPMAAWVKVLESAQVVRFVEGRAESDFLQQTLVKNPHFVVTLIDRKGKAILLTLLHQNKKLFALLPSRGPAFFEVPISILSFI